MFNFYADNDSGSDEETEETDTWTNRTDTEINVYRSLPEDLEAEPLIFWCTHANTLPLLASLAKKYLCVPATSVPVERLFTKAGGVVTKQRSRLTPENSNALISLASWLG